MTDPKPHGLARNVANYGDREFSLYLRRTFAASMGYSRTMLEKPVVGIADTAATTTTATAACRSWSRR